MRSKLTLAFLILAASCDGFYTANPNNCVVNPGLCDSDSTCNVETKHCEPVVLPPPPNRFVIGQPDPATIANFGYGLNGPQGVLLFRDGGASGQRKLAVADTLNNRVLIWNQIPQRPEDRTPPDVVLGQPGATTNVSNNGGISAKSLSRPVSISSDGQRLIVGDNTNNRILIYNSIPTRSGSAADSYWGQRNFNTATQQATPLPSALSSTWVFAMPLPGRGLYVADNDWSRVLVFDDLPTSTALPQFVIGQVSGTVLVPGSGATELKGSAGAPYSDGMSLFVTDTGNNRVQTYALPVQSNAPAAQRSIGQSCPSSKVANAMCMSAPSGVVATDCGGSQCLWVVDSGCHRILRFRGTNSSAELVLGHPDVTTRAANNGTAPTAATLNGPKAISSDGQQLAVADTANNRVLLWNQLPSTANQPADVILGQPTPTLSLINAPPRVDGLSLQGASSVATDKTHLVVADPGFHRVLIWNQIPQNGQTPPDVVLGQADLTQASVNGGSPTATQSSFNTPVSVSLDEGRLAVADQGNHRVLIFGQLPSQNNAPADLVIGQPDFVSSLPNHTAGSNPPPSDNSLFSPGWVHQQGGTLFVADTSNHRVLIYKRPYDASALPIRADVVIGQEQMTTQDVNHLGPSAASLNQPGAVISDGARVLISDTANNRILIFSALPTSNYASADVVLGQPNFTNITTSGRAVPEGLSGPRGLYLRGSSLYAVDRGQNRIVYWRTLPTTSYQPADGALGQPDLLSSLQNNSALPPLSWLNAPNALVVGEKEMYIADAGNSRIVVTTPP